MQPNPNAGSMNFRRSQEDWQREAVGLRQAWQDAAKPKPASVQPPIVQAAVAGAQANAAANRPTLPPGPPVVQTQPKAAPTLYEPFTPQPVATSVGSFGAATPKSVVAPPTQSPFTQAAVAGAQANAASRPQPPAPIAPRTTLDSQFSSQALGVPQPSPVGTFAKPGPSNVNPPPVRPALREPNIAGNFVVEPEGLLTNTLPGGASRPLSPEELLDQKIRNGREANRGQVVTPLTDEQKAKAQADTARAFANEKGAINVSRQPNGVMEFSGANIKAGDAFEGNKYNLGSSGFKPSGAGVNTMSAANFMSASPSLRNQVSDGRAAALARGDVDAVAASFGLRPAGGGGGGGGGSGVGRPADTPALKELRAAANVAKPNLKAIIALANAEKGIFDTNENNRTSRANNAETNETSRRNQDVQLQRDREKTAAEQRAVQAQRQRMADTLRESQILDKDGKPTGDIDYSRAMQSALASGDAAMADTFAKYLDGQQKLTKGKNDIENANMERFERFGPLRNEKGEPDKVGNQQFLNSILSQYPELMKMGDTELNKVMPEIVAEQSVLQKVNTALREQSGLGYTNNWLPTLPNWIEGRGSYEGRVPDSFFQEFGNTKRAGWLGGGWGAKQGDKLLGNGGFWNNKLNLGTTSDLEDAYIAKRIDALRNQQPK